MKYTKIAISVVSIVICAGCTMQKSVHTTNKINKPITGINHAQFCLINRDKDLAMESEKNPCIGIKVSTGKRADNKDDYLRIALNEMFGLGTPNLGELPANNYLYPSDLTAESVETIDDVTTVRIEGKLVGKGTMVDQFIKTQITGTVEYYTDKYIIILNDSESNWRCALDARDRCDSEGANQRECCR